MKTRLVIFDLDGTLLNTISDLGMACNHALSAFGLPTHDISLYPRMVGNGVNRLIERALPLELRSEDMVMKLKPQFLLYYNHHNTDCTVPYSGIPELLHYLREQGIMLAVASNKYQAAVDALITHYFPDIFCCVAGEKEGVPRKPDPAIVDYIITQTGIDEGVVYVGDSLVDIQTAKNAHLPIIACTWGFQKADELIAADPYKVVNNCEELKCALISNM